MWSHQGRIGRKITSNDLLAMLFLMLPRIPLALLATRAYCWLMKLKTLPRLLQPSEPDLTSTCLVYPQRGMDKLYQVRFSK